MTSVKLIKLRYNSVLVATREENGETVHSIFNMDLFDTWTLIREVDLENGNKRFDFYRIRELIAQYEVDVELDEQTQEPTDWWVCFTKLFPFVVSQKDCFFGKDPLKCALLAYENDNY